MFTGIIQTQGIVRQIRLRGQGLEILVQAEDFTPPPQIGDSIAVCGVCLTVESFQEHNFRFYCSSETLDKTWFKSLQVGQKVNLEPALCLADVIGGHLVQGHVDGVGKVTRAIQGDGETLEVRVPPLLQKYLLPKGSIAVDGVSLTIAKVYGDRCAFALIPTTLDMTNLASKQPGDPVNLEVDVIGKWVEHFLNPS